MDDKKKAQQRKKCGNKRGMRDRKRRACQRYLLQARQERNKERHLKRHLIRCPKDEPAISALEKIYEKYPGWRKAS